MSLRQPDQIVFPGGHTRTSQCSSPARRRTTSVSPTSREQQSPRPHIAPRSPARQRHIPSSSRGRGAGQPRPLPPIPASAERNGLSWCKSRNGECAFRRCCSTRDAVRNRPTAPAHLSVVGVDLGMHGLTSAAADDPEPPPGAGRALRHERSRPTSVRPDDRVARVAIACIDTIRSGRCPCTPGAALSATRQVGRSPLRQEVWGDRLAT
jgi:hypothetical protein